MKDRQGDANQRSDSSPLLNVVSFGDKLVPGEEGFRGYVAEVSSNFCPYIEPSATKECTTYTVVHSDTRDKEEAEQIVFASGYALCELLRRKRLLLSSGQRAPLLCENVLFLFPHIEDALGKELLAWPHWILKCRYTQIGILFGKFWKSAQETAKDGRELPVPPCHFISVRESVRARDPIFFEQAEWLRPALESSHDVGQNVFDDLSDLEDVDRALKAFCEGPTRLSFERVHTKLLSSSFYGRAKESATSELEARKRRNVNRKEN